jgi:flagellar hook-associated protein 3 FlgL
MRITNTMQLNEALLNEGRVSNQMYQLTQEASSGMAVSAPADDPVAYASIVSSNEQISTLQARSTAATTAGGDLSLADGALSSASDVLVQAEQIATVQSNGTQTAADRATAATQVTQLVQQMIALGNTQGQSGYIFGGTKTGSPPFDASGNYSGNGDSTTLEIASGVTVTTNASGASAFTAAGGSNVIADLQALATALSGNDVATIQSSVGQINSDNSQVVAARVNAGVSAQQLQSATQVIGNAVIADQTSLASTQDADVATVYSQLSAVQTSYQAALSVTRQVLSMDAFEGQ